MAPYSKLRLRYSGAVSPSSLPVKPLSVLAARAAEPPERLHRSAASTEEPIIFYIFRIPGRRELCLNMTKPGGDVITDIDISSSFYCLRFDNSETSQQMVLLRMEPDERVMNEVATLNDPPGRIDVYEPGYANIEPTYWNVNDKTQWSEGSSFGCHLTNSHSSLTFTTPWVGNAEIIPSITGNSLKCYHTVPHVEGDQTRVRVQISELRFNFSMPKASASGQVVSKRSSVALQFRNSSAINSLNSKRRSWMRSSADSTRTASSRTSDHSTSPQSSPLPRSDSLRHPSFRVPSSTIPPLSEGHVSIPSRDNHEASGGPYPSMLQEVSEKTSHGGLIGSNARSNQRIMGPRPLPQPGMKTTILGEGVGTGTVSSGTPIQAESHIAMQPQQAEASSGMLRMTSPERTVPPSEREPAAIGATILEPDETQAPPSSRLRSNSQPMSIKRKPIRSGTDSSLDSPATPVAEQQNGATVISGTEARTEPRAVQGTIRRRPVSMIDSTFNPKKSSRFPTFQSSVDISGQRLSPPDDLENEALPPLPPRPAHASMSPPPALLPGQLDLSLGQEKLGGGFDGEQAKLGKLIIEAEGQKMLDLIVAANLLAFHRAFVAADMMARR